MEKYAMPCINHASAEKDNMVPGIPTCFLLSRLSVCPYGLRNEFDDEHRAFSVADACSDLARFGDGVG